MNKIPNLKLFVNFPFHRTTPPIKQKTTPIQTRCNDQKLKNLLKMPEFGDWKKKDEIINRIKQVVSAMKTFRFLKKICFISAVRQKNNKSTFKFNQDRFVLQTNKHLGYLQQYKLINQIQQGL